MRRNFTPDDTLIDNLLLDDTSAFEELFHRYSYFLYSYCLGKLNSPDDARRIVSNIFIALWENRHHLPIDFSISSFLYTEVRKNIVHCVNEKLRDETNTDFIQKQIIPGFQITALQKARQPISAINNKVFKKEYADTEKRKHKEPRWNKYPSVFNLRYLKHSLWAMLNFW